MLKKFVSDTGKDWDKWLPFSFCILGRSPELNFSAFELIYAHQVRGPMDVLCEILEESGSPVLKMQEELMKTTPMA